MTWQQWAFVLCFGLIAVGGTWWVSSDTVWGAIATLAAMTVVAMAVWLAIITVVARLRDREGSRRTRSDGS